MTSNGPHFGGELERALGAGRLERDVELAPFTTFQIGGPADFFVRARTADELASAVTTARSMGIPWFLLGRGANILVGDRGYRGLVILSEVGGIDFPDETSVRAGAGVQSFPDLIDATVERGLGGLHHFVGIPSTVGGALWQNLHFLSPAPARERTVFIAEVLESADLLTEEGERKQVDVDSATFRLVPTPVDELHRVMRENLAWRKERHPDLARHPSAGSIFQKIEGIGAGRLIDGCGLKGHVHGGAGIFDRHANIIVNLGGATAAEVRALIALAQETVLRETGHELTPEIAFVGEF